MRVASIVSDKTSALRVGSRRFVRREFKTYRGRAVILGDGAHGMLPHHGQGANHDRGRCYASRASRQPGCGAYDQEGVYASVSERHPEAAVIVPPRSTAVLSQM